MKRYALLLSIATVTGCEYWPLPNGASDAGVHDAGSLDASALDASSDAADSGLVRDGGTAGDVDGGGATSEGLDAAFALDAAPDAECGRDFDPVHDGGALGVSDAPPWILARCGVGRHGHGGPGALPSAALGGAQLACVEHWLATSER